MCVIHCKHLCDSRWVRADFFCYDRDALNHKKDMGHYGRFVFTMVALRFLAEDEVVTTVAEDKDFSEEQARSLHAQIKSHDYNLPSRKKILQYQLEQEFPIILNLDDPGEGIYKQLNAPVQWIGRLQDSGSA